MNFILASSKSWGTTLERVEILTLIETLTIPMKKFKATSKEGTISFERDNKRERIRP